MITRSESQTLDRERSNPVTIELGERPEPCMEKLRATAKGGARRILEDANADR